MRYKVFSTFWPLGGLTPGTKFTKKGEDLVAYYIYHRAKFHRPRSTHARDIRYHVTKVLRTKKQKNKQTNSKRYIHNMPIGMCG